jgi:cytochrome P450
MHRPQPGATARGPLAKTRSGGVVVAAAPTATAARRIAAPRFLLPAKLAPRPGRARLLARATPRTATTTTPPTTAPQLVTAANPSAPPPKAAPVVNGPLPLLGPLDRVSLKALFKGVDDLHKELKGDIFRMSLLGTTAFQVRDPQLMAALQKAPSSLVSKTTEGFKRVESWLGHTLFNEDDLARHAELREALAPAFSPAGVRAQVPLFERVGDELAAAMAALGGDGDGEEQQKQVDAEQLCRRATMDAIGRAAFGGYDFGAVAAALPTQPDESSDAATAAAPPTFFAPPSSPFPSPPASPTSASPTPGPNTNNSDDMRDILDVWDRLLRTAMLLSFNFPLPDAFVPGWADYQASLARLNGIIDAILAEKQQRVVDGEEDASNNSTDLLSALLRGKRERPDLFTQESVRSTLHLFFFAGSDTTASLLAFLFYELSRRPEAQRRCAAEARAAVRAAASAAAAGGDNPYAPAKLPFLTACLNETLRLYPPGTDTARRAAADLNLGGYFVPKGSLLLLNNVSLHRHERFWPRAEEWRPERWIPSEAAEALGLDPSASSKFPAAGAGDTFQPFGVGARACIGRLFAMLEATVLASRVLASLELSPGDEEVALLQKFTLSSEKGVFVRVRRRELGEEEGEVRAAR